MSRNAIDTLSDMVRQAESCHDCRLKQVILLDLKAHWDYAWSLPDPHSYRPWLGDLRAEVDGLARLTADYQRQGAALYFCFNLANVRPLREDNNE